MFVKDSIKWVPGFGWGLKAIGAVFLKRNWLQDSKVINNNQKRKRKQK
jgi:lysophosphatidic acid acyltransferase/lysophosphatidylinositol acyltransferase